MADTADEAKGAAEATADAGGATGSPAQTTAA